MQVKKWQEKMLNLNNFWIGGILLPIPHPMFKGGMIGAGSGMVMNPMIKISKGEHMIIEHWTRDVMIGGVSGIVVGM